MTNAVLYIVPTPIGNLEDITQRAISTLMKVDIIAVENIFHTNNLLKHFNIKNKLISINNYNESYKTKLLINFLKKGNNIALVSNAGTPLINDPGYNLVFLCNKLNIKVIPLPGACAAITALSASGLPSNRFCYEGFLPIKKKRKDKLISLKYETRTMIFYESPYRVIESICEICNVFGEKRYIVLAKEITKIWESIKGFPVIKLIEWLKENKIKTKGEIVLIIEGYKKEKKDFFIPLNIKKIIIKLLKYMSVKKVVLLIKEIYGLNKNLIYNTILELKKNNS